MSLVTIADIADYCGAEVTDTDLIAIHNSVEGWFSSQCGRNLESDTYIERRDGEGTHYLILYNYPVTAIERVCIGTRTALTIKMTSGVVKSTRATVNVSSTELSLKVVGGTNEHDTITYTLADYTLGELAALSPGYGWSITLGSDTYSDYDSTEMNQVMGASALDTTVYLYMPESPEEQIEVYGDGTVYLPESVFWTGRKNVLVEYTAGYTSSTVPDDLKGAILTMCSALYEKLNDEGLKSFSLGDISKTFADGYPVLVSSAVSKYQVKIV